MNNRRKLVIALGVNILAAPFFCHAQRPEKIHIVGILAFGNAASVGRLYEFFTQGLRKLGYVEGKNIAFERRFADGDPDRLAALAAELVQKKVDVIFTPTTVSARAARQATATIPIVFANVDDPVASGLIASLARPGGNVTGTAVIQQELSAKRLQVLTEISPKSSRIALVVSSEPQAAAQATEIERAAKILGVTVLPIRIGQRQEYGQELTRLRTWRANGLYVLATAENYNNRKLIAEFADSARLPAIFPAKDYLDFGGLVSYGIDTQFMFHYVAGYVDKILKGAKPADLPVEQPMRFEFAINMRTAKALGVKISNSILVRADKVIE